MSQNKSLHAPSSIHLPHSLCVDLAFGRGSRNGRGKSLDIFWSDSLRNPILPSDSRDRTPASLATEAPPISRSSSSSTDSMASLSGCESSRSGSGSLSETNDPNDIDNQTRWSRRGSLRKLGRSLSRGFSTNFARGAPQSNLQRCATLDADTGRVDGRESFKPGEKSTWLLDMKCVELGSLIATGMSGKVYSGLYDGQAVALKILRVPETQVETEHLNKQFNSEFSALQELQHENVVKLVGICTRGAFKCLVTEFIPGGTLRDMLKKRREPLPFPRIISMALDIAQGMAYLHSKGIFLRDLKSENLLLTEEGTVKICDFGSSKSDHLYGCHTGEVGTFRWMAPEVMDCKRYNRKVDVYSFSIVLWELLTLDMPYPGMTAYQVAYAVFQKGLRPPIPEGCPPHLAPLMSACWNQNPKKRPEFRHVINTLRSMCAV